MKQPLTVTEEISFFLFAIPLFYQTSLNRQQEYAVYTPYKSLCHKTIPCNDVI